jgi:hypothetical protein
MKKVRRFKFLRTGLKSEYNDFQWEMGKWYKTECVEICYGFNCSKRILDALSYVKGEILAEVEVRGKKFIGTDKSTHAEMRIIRVWEWTKRDSVSLSVFSAELVIGNYEKLYPNDGRPRKAIEAAREWIANPSAASAESAAWSAESAASAAWSAASAESAASAAWSAAMWSAASAESAAWSAASAESAAWSAASAASAVLDKINEWLLSHLTEMDEWRSGK